MAKNENTFESLANQLEELDKKIVLIYAFNGTGKTRLSVAYRDITKTKNAGKQTGVYYNAYSEDLFVWDNDYENNGANIRLLIQKSSLNQFHASLDENKLREKLKPYKPIFDFRFMPYTDVAEGIESVQFFLENNKESRGSKKESTSPEIPIKISRGEEQVFIWSLFLTLFDIEGWTGEGKQSSHFFIDDPVSSLDDHNIFVTVASVMDLIDRHYKDRKIIITTHHFGFISILYDWLTKGEKSGKYKNQVKTYILKKSDKLIQLVNPDREVFLYHLELMQILDKAIKDDKLYAYHFALLRQVLENIASFLGVGRISYVLEKIGLGDSDRITQVVNTMNHKNVFRYEAKELVPDNEELFKEIFNKIQSTYNFVLHTKDK